jgi:hypothetical protein
LEKVRTEKRTTIAETFLVEDLSIPRGREELRGSPLPVRVST